MTESNGAATPTPTPDENATEKPQPKMQILGQFIRDMSFENAAATKTLASNVQPDMQVQVALDARKRETEDQYDVVMKLKLDSKTKGDDPEAIFLMELEYAGIFKIENVPEAQLHPFLLIECPRMLFPFVRRIVSDVTRDGGFPPVNLDTIDFLSLYRQQIAQRAAAQQAAPAQA